MSQDERIRTAKTLFDPTANAPYKDKLKWFDTSPISPPHGFAKDSMLTTKAFPQDLVKDCDGNLMKAKITDVLDQIAYLKFKPVENNNEGRLGAITFKYVLARDLRTNASRDGLIPCWFLPWQSRKLLK